MDFNFLKNTFKYILIIGITFNVSLVSAKKDDKSNFNLLERLKLKENDEKGNEIRSAKAEYLIRKSEIKAINQLKALVKKHKGKRLEPDLLFRLTELYMRRIKAERFFEVHRESNIVTALLPKIVKNASSKKYVKKSIKIYDYIIKKYPNYSQIDLILFNNAFARQEIEDYKNADKLYWKIIKKHPDSDLVPDAHLAIGEIAFVKKKFKHALQHFKSIKKYPNSKVYPYGLYKTAWSLYNLNQGQSAIVELEKVVKFSRNKKSQSNFNLLSEALTDLTLFYQEVYKSKDAYNYFAKVTKPDELSDIILGLSDIYKRHSKYKDVNTVLGDFYKKNPKHENIHEFINELAWNFESLRLRPKATEYLVKLNDLCKIKKNESCNELILDSSLSLGHKWRNLWVKNNKNEIFGQPSEVAFRIYLESSKIDKESLEVRYLLAEMLFARSKFRQASKEYLTVSKTSPDKDKNHESAYASIVSLQKATKDKWNNEDQKHYVTIADYYLNKYKDGKYRLDVEFKKALIDYEKNNFELAKPIFAKLGNLYPKKEKGLKSQDLYLDILNSEKNYKEIKSYSQKLISKSENPKRKSDIQKVYEQAYFLQVQNIEKSKKHLNAYTEYEKFFNENKKSKLAPKALWNSAIMLVKINKPAKAAAQYDKYFNNFPKHEDSKNALVEAARLYEGTAQLDNAAKILEKLAKIDTKKSSSWIQTAAEFYYVEENYSKSIQLFTQLTYNSDKKIKENAINKLINISKNSTKNGVKHNLDLNKIILKNGSSQQKHFAYLDIATKQLTQNNYKAAFKTAANVNRRSKDNDLKSEATYIMAMVLKQELVSQSLKSSVNRITDVLALKINKLDKAQQYFLNTIKMANPENNVKAMYNLSLCYKDYIESLQNMPTPRGLPESEVDGFRVEIENIISPMEDKYVETLHQTYITAKKQYNTDIDLAKVQKKLLDLKVSLNFSHITKYSNPKSEIININRVVTNKGGK